jgi:diguanylate cyclase (GGDEF)-like protein
MKRWFVHAPIGRKLTAVMALTTTVALLLAAMAVGVYETVAFRRTLVERMTVTADIAGRNSTAALAFGDRTVARDVLAALQTDPAITAAAVYDRDGKLFASYVSRNGHDAPVPDSAGSLGSRFGDGSLMVVRAIVLDGEQIGTVHLRAGLDDMWSRGTLFAAVLLIIVVGCTLLALAISARLQRWISAPILNLARTTRLITSERNFSLRADAAGRDEVGALVDDFNRMLAEIEQQDHRLRENKEQLEAEVSHRTTELVNANARLVESMQRVERHADQIAQLTHFSHLLQSCQTDAEVFGVVGHALRKLFPSESGAVAVLNASRNLMEATATWGIAPPTLNVFAPDECWSYRLGRPHLVPDAASPLRCAHLGHGDGPITFCVPMAAQGDTIGVLQFMFSPGDAPDQDENGSVQSTRGRLAMALAEQIALALGNLRLREALRNQSIVDPLTGLYNRRYLENVLDRECRRVARSGRHLSVLMMDVDHFKRFNDMWGHDGGDAVLHDLADLMRTMFRGEDVACRYGGEEFVVLLSDTPLDDARRRAEEMRLAVHRLSVRHRQQSLGGITISLGVAAFPNHGFTPEALLAAADRALYIAKAEGRDRTVCATGDEMTSLKSEV